MSSLNGRVLLIFPHQLFENHAGLTLDIDQVILIEDSLFFKDHQYPINFHCKKLILHRASMKAYAANLSQQGFNVRYCNSQPQLLDRLFTETASKSQQIVISDCVDFALNKRLKKLGGEHSVEINWLRSQLFLNSNEENTRYRAGKKRWFMADFYQYQRRKLNLLMDENDKPIGGKWSFDEENRKKIPKKLRTEIPQLNFPTGNEWVTEARDYVKNNFPDTIGCDVSADIKSGVSVDNEDNIAGDASDFEYPVTSKDAHIWLDEFLIQRFAQFGPYEDALVPQQSWLYHSILSPIMNIGLISPQDVIDKTMAYAKTNEIPLSSLEGFIRQIIGWREFMRATYVDLGVSMRTTNHWQHHRKIPKSFYTGTTGIEPIDDVIKRVLKTSYCHHIERLMVLGGFMFLCEFDPDEIYRWFMELFIDSYDWVMVPNVYAMSQNADGGLITTKPYFSGSSYLKKMGYDNLQGDWCEIWDGLYWRWIHLHQEELAKNPRWAMMCAMARKMDQQKMEVHLANAEQFLQSLNIEITQSNWS